MASVCSQCGSRSWRADRSLAGRLVCTRCGTPQGAGSGTSRSLQRGRGTRGRLPWWWWVVLVLVVALLIQLL
ncbi:MAG: transcriptional regulator [Synechococcus sp.]